MIAGFPGGQNITPTGAEAGAGDVHAHTMEGSTWTGLPPPRQVTLTYCTCEDMYGYLSLLYTTEYHTGFVGPTIGER